MSHTLRYLALALALVAASASHQQLRGQSRPQVYSPPVQPNPFIAPGLTLQQAAYNTTVMGRAYQNTLPYAGAIAAAAANPYGGGFMAGPALPAAPLAVNPYALSTAAGYNPYAGGTGSLAATSPYSLSTTGSPGGGYVPPYSTPYNPYAGGYGYQDPYGSALQGTAALTASIGQYHLTTQQARMAREQARQAALDTTKKRIELERWYEATKPSAQQVRDREVAAELERARKDSTDAEVASGRALNALLASIQKTGSLNRGPNVELDADTLKNLNLTGDGTLGNVGMLRDVKSLIWPDLLKEDKYNKTRETLAEDLERAVASIKDRDPVPENTLKNIRADYKTLNDRLNDSADDLTPAQYIEARRFLNGLNQAIRALGDKNVAKHFNNKWNAQGKNVAELVAHMTKEGLSFAAATAGDQAAYKALYLALRQYEAGLLSAQK